MSNGSQFWICSSAGGQSRFCMVCQSEPKGMLLFDGALIMWKQFSDVNSSTEEKKRISIEKYEGICHIASI